MREKMRRIILIMCATILCCANLVHEAGAAQTVCNGVMVTISLEGDAPDEAEDYIVKLKAEDVTNPMPKNSENGEFTLKVSGASSIGLPEIVYDKVGIYTYTIWQEKGENEEVIYDERVYELKVQVTNAEYEDGLETVIILNKNDEAEKQLNVEFINQYPPEPTPTPTPGGDVETGDHAPIGTCVFLMIMAAICLGAALKKIGQHE